MTRRAQGSEQSRSYPQTVQVIRQWTSTVRPPHTSQEEGGGAGGGVMGGISSVVER